MANTVNKIMLERLRQRFEAMGSCLVLSFDKLTVAQAAELRNQLRDAGVELHVVKNRLAAKAFDALKLDLRAAFQGKCGVVVAPEEGAIRAARLVRDAMQKVKGSPVSVTGGVIEGEVITGPRAASIADMPDKNTVRAQLAAAIAGVARALAVCVQSAGPAGLARVIQARIDDAGESQPA